MKGHRKYPLFQLNFQGGKGKEVWPETFNAILKCYTFSYFLMCLTHVCLTSEYRDRT
jgi:hypothetical protein